MRTPTQVDRRASGTDAVCGLLSQLYGANIVPLDSGDSRPPSIVHERWELGHARVDLSRHGGSFACAAEPIGTLLVTRMLAGTVNVRARGRELRGGRGDTMLLADPGQEFTVSLDGAHMHHVGVDVATVQRIAGASMMAEHVIAGLRYGVLRADAALPWQRTVRYVTDVVLADPIARSSPLIVQSATNLLASTLLSVFLPQLAHAREFELSPQLASVRSAREFIEANADVALTVADIARSVALTPRALQMGFRRHLDTTPMAHLRSVRLDRLRTDLGNADPFREQTVTELAARWGLAGTAYAQAYLRAYGEQPSATLRAARGLGPVTGGAAR